MDFVSAFDNVRPLVRLLAASLTAVVPCVLVVALGGHGGGWTLLRLGTGLFAVAYLPAAVANASYSETLRGALNPLPALALIARIPREYALLTGGLLLVSLVALMVPIVCGALLGRLMILPIVPALLVNSASLVLPMMMARATGLVLRERATELGLEARNR